MEKTDILSKSLNANDAWLINKTYTVGDRDMIHILSPSKVHIDYLALYSQPSDYQKIPNTALCFYESDLKMDSRNGLWNSIRYGDKKRLNEFKKRFECFDYAILPDYSMCGDGLETANAYNIQRSREVGLWLVEECGVMVIPNITYADEKTFTYLFDGLEDCSVIAYSTKGTMKKPYQVDLLKQAIHLSIEKLSKLKTIIVYSVALDDSKTLNLFEEAIDNGIDVVIPDNLLKSRNRYNKASASIINFN